MTLSVVQNIQESTARWDFSGSLDKNTVSDWISTKNVKTPLECNRWVLNFQALDYIDSAGLAFCLQCAKESKKNNILLEILNAPDRLHALAGAQGIEFLLKEILKK